MKRVYLVVIYFCLFLTACGSTEKETADTDDIFKFKYEELSEISSLSNNSVVKYSEQYTSANLYNWTENVVLPIPSPGDMKEEKSYERMLTFSGIDESQWDKYVQELKIIYPDIIIGEKQENIDEALGYSHKTLTIYDETYNMRIIMVWYDKLSYIGNDLEQNNLENVILVNCYLGNQEFANDLNNKTIKEKICRRLNDITTNDLKIFDVSSRNNIIDGYRVYYVQPLSTQYIESEMVCMYLCVMKDDEIVFLNHNEISIGKLNNEIEFVKYKDKNYMYILSFQSDKDPSMSNCGNQIIDIYELIDNNFNYDKRIDVNKLEGFEEKWASFEKKDGTILLRDFAQIDDRDKAYNECYYLGNEMKNLNIFDENMFKYKELSYISGLTNNNTANLTAEHTEVKLYQWSEGVNMPVEKPEGAMLEKNTDELLRFSGVTKDVWRAYCEELEKNYTVISVLERGEIGDPYGSISITSQKDNWTMAFNWLEKSLNGDCEGELKVILSMGNQEPSNYGNEIILDDVSKIVGCDSKNCFVKNISTHSNIENGFEVFYIDTFNDFNIPYDIEDGKERPFMYLCVMYDGKMVYLQENVLHSDKGYYYDVEFTKDSNDIEMYILTQSAAISGIGNNQFLGFKVDVYKLRDMNFIFDRTYTLNDYAEYKDKAVTLNRVDNEIQIYEVKIKTGIDILYTEKYSLGEKLGVLK